MLQVARITCEYLPTPLGLDTPRPRFGWELEADARGVRQTAYRVRVASSPEHLAAGRGDLWDSGRIESDRPVHVEYAGAALASRQRCWWNVSVWAVAAGGPAMEGTSEAGWFEMALLEAGDWKGEWIAAAPEVQAPMMRKAFTLGGAPASARAYVCGLGWHEL